MHLNEIKPLENGYSAENVVLYLNFHTGSLHVAQNYSCTAKIMLWKKKQVENNSKCGSSLSCTFQCVTICLRSSRVERAAWDK